MARYDFHLCGIFKHITITHHNHYRHHHHPSSHKLGLDSTDSILTSSPSVLTTRFSHHHHLPHHFYHHHHTPITTITKTSPSPSPQELTVFGRFLYSTKPHITKDQRRLLLVSAFLEPLAELHYTDKKAKKHPVPEYILKESLKVLITTSYHPSPSPHHHHHHHSPYQNSNHEFCDGFRVFLKIPTPAHTLRSRSRKNPTTALSV